MSIPADYVFLGCNLLEETLCQFGQAGIDMFAILKVQKRTNGAGNIEPELQLLAKNPFGFSIGMTEGGQMAMQCSDMVLGNLTPGSFQAKDRIVVLNSDTITYCFPAPPQLRNQYTSMTSRIQVATQMPASRPSIIKGG